MRIRLLFVIISLWHTAWGQSKGNRIAEEQKLKEWVLSNKLITLADDTVFINGLPTTTMQVVKTDTPFISIEIPLFYDSMMVTSGRYNGAGPLVPIAMQRCRETKTEYNISTGLVDERHQRQVAALFIHAYQHGTKKIFCRIVLKAEK
jgi:hypothetical protein